MGRDLSKLYCSFCGKSQQEVKKLIAGPTVFICNECIKLCNDIIESEGMAIITSGKAPEVENKKLKKLLGEALQMLNTLTTTRTRELEAADKVIQKITALSKPEPPSETDVQPLSI